MGVLFKAERGRVYGNSTQLGEEIATPYKIFDKIHPTFLKWRNVQPKKAKRINSPLNHGKRARFSNMAKGQGSLTWLSYTWLLI